MNFKRLLFSMILMCSFGTLAMAQCPVITSSGVGDNSCFGDSEGSIILNVSGGVLPHTFFWSYEGILVDTLDNPNYLNLAAGNYGVSVTDALGCETTASYVVDQPNPFTFQFNNIIEPDCGQSNGSINVNVNGGTFPYTYQWTTGQTDSTLFNLSPGIYQTVNVTDVNNCESFSETYILESNSDLTVSVGDSSVSCSNDFLQLDPMLSGGSAPYQFSWTPAIGISDPSILSPIFSPSQTTDYTLTVIDDNDCVAFGFARIVVLDQPQNITTWDVKCFGGTSGAIQVGNGTIQTALNGGPFQNGIFFGLVAGDYSLEYISPSGCINQEVLTISQPPSALIVSGTTTDSDCQGLNSGSIDLTVSGANPPYSFQWSEGSNTEDLSNLSGGVYEVTVTSDSCSVIQQFVINEQSALSASVTVNNESCYGAENGQILAQGIGGTPPYDFIWSDGSFNQGLEGQTGLLPPGTFTLTVIDALGCTFIGDFTIQAAPFMEPIVISPPGPNPLLYACNDMTQGASVSVQVSGGLPATDFSDYLYSLEGSGTPADIENFPIPVFTPIDFEVADGANWTLKVFDNTGCDTVIISDVFNYSTDCSNCPNPANLQVNAGDDQSICDGAVQIGGSPTATSDVAIVSYEWFPTTNMTGGDTPNPVVDPDENTIYQVVVTDANGCVQTDEVLVLSYPAMQIEPAAITPSGCQPSGVIDLVNAGVIGGLPPYTWEWTGANGFSSNNSISVSGLVGNETYCLDITDNAGCVVSECFFVGIEPGGLAIINFQTSPDCGDEEGTAKPIVIGGSAPYTFLWTNGVTDSTATGLPDGNICVTVTDNAGCITVACENVPQSDCVWPGDANYDGFANNEDILAMGLTFGFTGPTRADASIDWTGQVADDWPGSFVDGVNHKHADSDGNGTVNYQDTIAISLNYGLEHPFNFSDPVFNADDPPIILIASADSVAPGELVTVELNYGDMDNPVVGAYGIALGITMEQDYVVPESVMADFSDSWLASPADQISLFKYLPGILEIGVSRIDLQNVDGFGKIAQFSFVIEDNIDGLVAIDPVELILELVNIKIISNDESELPFFPINDIVIIDPESTSILDPVLSDQILVYPNPASDRLIIEHKNVNIESLWLVDLLGRRTFIKQGESGDMQTLNLPELPSGVYILEILTDQGSSFKRFYKE